MQAADEYEFGADECKTQPVISDTYPIVMVVAFQFFHGPDADEAFRLFKEALINSKNGVRLLHKPLILMPSNFSDLN